MAFTNDFNTLIVQITEILVNMNILKEIFLNFSHLALWITLKAFLLKQKFSIFSVIYIVLVLQEEGICKDKYFGKLKLFFTRNLYTD